MWCTHLNKLFFYILNRGKNLQLMEVLHYSSNLRVIVYIFIFWFYTVLTNLCQYILFLVIFYGSCYIKLGIVELRFQWCECEIENLIILAYRAFFAYPEISICKIWLQGIRRRGQSNENNCIVGKLPFFQCF